MSEPLELVRELVPDADQRVVSSSLPLSTVLRPSAPSVWPGGPAPLPGPCAGPAPSPRGPCTRSPWAEPPPAPSCPWCPRLTARASPPPGPSAPGTGGAWSRAEAGGHSGRSCAPGGPGPAAGPRAAFPRSRMGPRTAGLGAAGPGPQGCPAGRGGTGGKGWLPQGCPQNRVSQLLQVVHIGPRPRTGAKQVGSGPLHSRSLSSGESDQPRRWEPSACPGLAPRGLTQQKPGWAIGGQSLWEVMSSPALAMAPEAIPLLGPEDPQGLRVLRAVRCRPAVRAGPDPA